MARRNAGTKAELYIKVAGLVVCLVVGYFLFSVTHHFGSTAWSSLGAIQGRAGVEGTLTVTHEKRVSSGSRTNRHCMGSFAPADGGTVRTDVRVHISGGECEVGRTEKARFVSGRESWLDSQSDSVYGESASVSGLILPFFFGVVFSGLVGLLCAVFAWAFGRELFRDLRRRTAAGRDASP